MVRVQSDLTTAQRVTTWPLSPAWPAVVHSTSRHLLVLTAPYGFGATAISFFGMCCHELKFFWLCSACCVVLMLYFVVAWCSG